MNASINTKKRSVMLSELPEKDVKDGICIEWTPTKRWLNEHSDVLAVARCDIETNKKVYELPSGLNPKRIFRVGVLNY